MNQHLQTILNLIQQAEHLTEEEKTALSKAAKNADKELEITSFKLERTEKVKRTTAILLEETIEELEHKRKAVEAQNRELEIESSLERVRTVAMSMNKPDDMLDVCRTISNQLELLAVKEIRNVQTAIFYKEKGTYMNYEYYAKHNKTFITETTYTNNEVHASFAEKMLKGNGEISISHIKGDEVKDWIKYQKTTNVFIDDYLYTASSLNYYWYSLGPVALGISTYSPLTEEEIDLFKRFLKVFELSYRRYLDIEKAEAQAREAQIEAALERVRSRSLAMHKSEQLADIISTICKEILNLGIQHEQMETCYIATFEGSEPFGEIYLSTSGGDLIPHSFRIAYDEDPLFKQLFAAWQNGDAFFVGTLQGEELKNHLVYLFSHIPGPILEMRSADFSVFPSETFTHALYFSRGYLAIITRKPVPGYHQLFKRFGSALQQSYTRFLDLQKAEAQARESQIQLSLERARTQSMIMQHSNELDDTLRVFHEQVLQLSIPSAFSFLWLPDEGKDRHIFWAAWAEDNATVFKSKAINYPLDRNEPATAQCLIDWKSNEPVVAYHVPPASVNDYFAAWNELITGVEELNPENFSDGLYYVEAFMKYGCFGVIVKNTLPEDEKNILGRFAIEFERAYTRFLDLQKAEAQAREAQIEAALERVRSRTIAMQRSEDLFEVIREVNAQLQLLNFRFDSADFLTDYSDKGYKLWVASVQESFTKPFYITAGNTKISRLLKEAMERGDDFFTFTLNREEKNKHFEHVFQASVAKDASDESKQFIYDAEGMAISCFVVKNIILSISNFACIPYTDAENEIIRRFAFVFEQSYTRFLDLQKAEAQAREAQIELGLERVRARAMAMQKSEELKYLISTVSTELGKLDIQIDRSFIVTYDTNTMDSIWWMANPETPNEPIGLHVPYHQHPAYLAHVEAWKERKVKWVYLLEGETKKTWGQFLFYQTELSKLPAVVSESMMSLQKVYLSTSFNNFGYLQIGTLEPLSDEQFNIMLRFAKVFDLTYTRFNDLKQAEAQLREAQIETALEKVRSRSLAMHKSGELQEVVHTVFEKLKELNVDLYTAIIFIFEEGSKDVVWWLANKVNQQYARILVPYENNPYLKDIFDAKESGKDFFAATYSFEEKNELFHHLFEHTDFKYVAEEQKKFLLKSELATMSVALAKNTGINITSYSRKSFSESDNEILKRFTKVFDQAYTRFLDLQKAEAQAREAQIEAALEKVRSRTMAMHKSEELIEVIATVFQQLEHLSFRIDSANLFLNYKENPFKFWMAVPGYLYPSELDVPYGDFAIMNRFVREIKSNATLVTAKFSQEEKNEWVRHLIQHSVVGNAPDEKKKQMFEAPGLAMSVAGVKNIALAITNYSVQSYSDEENEILRRFVIVFDQTYTRFLDLQKAEAQAREAQVEAALERVRSRTTGMQKSEELREVIQMVFEQLQHLGFNIDSAHFNLNYKESDDYNLWSAAPGQPYPVKTYIPYFDHPVFITAKQAKEKGLDFFTESYTQDEKNKFFEHLFKHAPVIPEERRKYILSAPGVAASTVLMNTISLWILNYAGIPYSEAENAILKRFGKVFEQTYTRFLDLEKAEAQALEAIKRASVDRVRAEIASMRTTSDLERITPLIWNELTTLGVPFIRCGVFIMDDEQQQVNTLLSTPDGKAIAAFHLSYNTPGEIAQIIASWRKKEMHKQHWNEAQFIEFTQNLLHQGAVTTGEKYLTENRPTDLYLHFLPFLQGMLYAGNTAPLNDDELQLMQNLADAFSTAYARYEDFNKLEEAKGRIETTLSELKATQHQLVQSEKMASLGELTAGIAHEIQNPLNFVNNFSEVNSELISELVDEIDKGNIEEVKAIAKDIKDNEEKITHHGKRADSIVKGMLLHSRVSTGQKEPTDINALCDEYLRLSYHGLRAKDKSFNADFKTDFDKGLSSVEGKINIVPQDIGRVLLNLYNNAFYAVRSPQPLKGGEYKPLVTVTTRKIKPQNNNAAKNTPPAGGDGSIEIRVTDNGNGIPQNIVDKIFQPFFTTKPTGQGTGLGLSLSYDIIKAHGGEINVESKEGEGSEFIIMLPI